MNHKTHEIESYGCLWIVLAAVIALAAAVPLAVREDPAPNTAKPAGERRIVKIARWLWERE